MFEIFVVMLTAMTILYTINGSPESATKFQETDTNPMKSKSVTWKGLLYTFKDKLFRWETNTKPIDYKKLHQEKPNINNSKTSKGENLILFWTFNYLTKAVGLDRVLMTHYDCGPYQCNITRNRTYLAQSKVIVFNPRSSNCKLT